MKHLLLAASALLALSLPAMAGTLVPLPLAGAVGPVGLGVIGLGYVVVRLLRRAR